MKIKTILMAILVLLHLTHTKIVLNDIENIEQEDQQPQRSQRNLQFIKSLIQQYQELKDNIETETNIQIQENSQLLAIFKDNSVYLVTKEYFLQKKDGENIEIVEQQTGGDIISISLTELGLYIYERLIINNLEFFNIRYIMFIDGQANGKKLKKWQTFQQRFRNQGGLQIPILKVSNYQRYSDMVVIIGDEKADLDGIQCICLVNSVYDGNINRNISQSTVLNKSAYSVGQNFLYKDMQLTQNHQKNSVNMLIILNSQYNSEETSILIGEIWTLGQQIKVQINTKNLQLHGLKNLVLKGNQFVTIQTQNNTEELNAYSFNFYQQTYRKCQKIQNLLVKNQIRDIHLINVYELYQYNQYFDFQNEFVSDSKYVLIVRTLDNWMYFISLYDYPIPEYSLSNKCFLIHKQKLDFDSDIFELNDYRNRQRKIIMMHNNQYKQMIICMPFEYLYNDECNLCPQDYYSSQINSEKCEKSVQINEFNIFQQNESLNQEKGCSKIYSPKYLSKLNGYDCDKCAEISNYVQINNEGFCEVHCNELFSHMPEQYIQVGNQCIKEQDQKEFYDPCSRLITCYSCMLQDNCIWNKYRQCSYGSDRKYESYYNLQKEYCLKPSYCPSDKVYNSKRKLHQTYNFNDLNGSDIIMDLKSYKKYTQKVQKYEQQQVKNLDLIYINAEDPCFWKVRTNETGIYQLRFYFGHEFIPQGNKNATIELIFCQYHTGTTTECSLSSTQFITVSDDSEIFYQFHQINGLDFIMNFPEDITINQKFLFIQFTNITAGFLIQQEILMNIAKTTMGLIILLCISMFVFKQWYQRHLRISSGQLLTKDKLTDKQIDKRIKKYKKQNIMKDKQYNDQANQMAFDQNNCVICLEDFQHGQNYIEIYCHHCFHLNCIKEWIRMRKKQCPVCKVEFQKQERDQKIQQQQSSNIEMQVHDNQNKSEKELSENNDLNPTEADLLNTDRIVESDSLKNEDAIIDQ